jgi:hypothetical protein
MVSPGLSGPQDDARQLHALLFGDGLGMRLGQFVTPGGEIHHFAGCA